MNESLDLRNRILKMRESNNLIVTEPNTLNNNLMSKFESSIKYDNSKNPKLDKNTINDKNNEKISNTLKNKTENEFTDKDKLGTKSSKKSVNDNEAQFLMLANKFNEAVEVILELSEKVEKLERITSQNSYSNKNLKNRSTFFNFKIFAFLLIIPILILAFSTFPFDFSLIKLILMDLFSKI